MISLLCHSIKDSLENTIEDTKKIFLVGNYTLLLKTIQRGDSIYYLSSKLFLQKLHTKRSKLGNIDCRLLMTFKDC